MMKPASFGERLLFGLGADGWRPAVLAKKDDAVEVFPLEC